MCVLSTLRAAITSAVTVSLDKYERSKSAVHTAMFHGKRSNDFMQYTERDHPACTLYFFSKRASTFFYKKGKGEKIT